MFESPGILYIQSSTTNYTKNEPIQRFMFKANADPADVHLEFLTVSLFGFSANCNYLIVFLLMFNVYTHRRTKGLSPYTLY